MDIKGAFKSAFVSYFLKFALLAATLAIWPNLSRGAQQVPLIFAGGSWDFYHNTNAPRTGWKGAFYFTSTAIGWSTGVAPIGYGDPGMGTVVTWPEGQPRPITTYFRRVFTIADASQYSALILNLRRDDGAVVYLNGHAIARSNMPDGEPGFQTPAPTTTGSEDETRFFRFEVPSTFLRTGTNIVAVEVHQANVASSDMVFDLDLQAVTDDATTKPVVSLEILNAITSEPSFQNLLPGTIYIRRSGRTNDPLPLRFIVSGTAVPGVDYTWPSNNLVIPAGRSDLLLSISALADTRVETNEYATFRIAESTNYLQYPGAVQGTITIRDEDAPPPTLVFTTPTNGQTILPGSIMNIRLVARDPSGYIPRVLLRAELDSGEVINLGDFVKEFETPPADGTPIVFETSWANVQPGIFRLQATGFTSAGANAFAQPVTVTVTAPGFQPLIGIEVTQQNTWEPGDVITPPAQFRIWRTGPTDESLVVFLALTGTATPGVDYIGLSNVVTFPAGRSVLHFNVFAQPDSLTEGSENLMAEIIVPGNPVWWEAPYLIDQTNRFGIAYIYDPEPHPGPFVSIQATRPLTSEPPPITLSGEFTVTRTGPTNEALNVWLRYSGTAIRGVDFNDISNLLVIPAGRHTAAFNIVPRADFLMETNETVVAEVLPGTNGVIFPYLVDPTRNLAVVTIQNSVTNPPPPVVSLETTRQFTTETNPLALVVPGEFTLRRTGSTSSNLAISINIGGTATMGADYVALSNVVRFGIGQSEVKLHVSALQDTLVESNETVVAQLVIPPTSGALPYTIDPLAHTGIVIITDFSSEPAKVEITQPYQGQEFELGEEIIITARARDPRGYVPRVQFFDGDFLIHTSQIEFVVAPPPGTSIVHEIRWFNARAGVHHLGAHGFSSTGETIISEPVTIIVKTNLSRVSIVASVPSTSEPSPTIKVAPGEFTVRRAGPTNTSLNVTLNFSGTATRDVDYGASANVLIPAGKTEAKVLVTAFGDQVIEPDETVIATVMPQFFGGGMTYLLDEEHRSATVTIRDSAQGSERVILAVEVPDRFASEAGILTVIDPAVFVIKRVGGPTNVPVLVNFRMSGTASNGVDYARISNNIFMSSNQTSVEVRVNAIFDTTPEGNESVVLTLLPSSCFEVFPPLPSCYMIGEPAIGEAIIRDAPLSNQPPVIHLVKPAHGAVFTVRQGIEILAEASDPDGTVGKIEIFDNDHVIGVAYTNRISFTWWGATIGNHVLLARAIDNHGRTGTTTNVILVREQNASAFVFRSLPDAYIPASALTVELRAEPPTGSRAYGVEDHPPTGWTVSQISHEGVFDPTTGKVKFGPFIDGTARTLTYRLMPPSSATGPKEFAGVGSVDGASYPTGGDRVIQQGSQKHPADKDGNWAIVIDELTAYAAAWKSGGSNSWNIGPVPIPLSFVTRAGLIWRRGEVYRFDSALGAPPLCWVPVNGLASNLLAAASLPTEPCVRVGAETLTPGLPTEMQINVAPPSGVSAYAVEERVPEGWTVTNVSHEGKVDLETRTIRWGMYLDGGERALRYTLTPRADVAEIARLRGTVSFDGGVREITGREQIVSVQEQTRPRLEKCETDSTGVRLRLAGAVGQVGVLQRSNDLVNWNDLTTLFLPDGTIEYKDETTTDSQAYYRLQVR